MLMTPPRPLLLAAGSAALMASGPASMPVSHDAVVDRGHAIYAAECAGCHGSNLEGQPGWQTRLPNGLLPAPPHDASGHTWQHSDVELHDLIAFSTWRFFAPNYRTTMPAYVMRLNKSDIAAIIAYFKNTWPPFERTWQASLNPGGTFKVTPAGDWRFPSDCGFHDSHRQPR